MINWALKPLVNQPSIYAKRLANKIDEPVAPSQHFDPKSYLGRYEDLANKMNTGIRGGLAGMTEGVGDVISGMTSPLSLAGYATGGLASLAGRMAGGLSNSARAISPTMDLIESNPVKQVVPAMDDVSALIGDMTRNLTKIPNKGARIVKDATGIAPSMLPAEMIGAGGEAAYNADRAAKMAQYAIQLDDLAEAGNRAARGKFRMPIGGNFNVADEMAKVASARGR